MTAAKHRAPADQATVQPTQIPRGGAPHGMWAIAWRQHRIQIAVLLAIVAAAAAALALARMRIVSLYTRFGCELRTGTPYRADCLDDTGNAIWWNYGLSTLTGLAHLAMIAGPIVLGAFAAAPIFTREFSRGTHILALTQSISRRRWYATKITVMAVPLVVGLVVLGYLIEWLDNTVDTTAYGALDVGNFFARGIIPAGTGLAVFGLTIAIGMFSRNTVTALVVGGLVGAALLFGMGVSQAHLLASTRTITPLAEMFPLVTQEQVDAEVAGESPPGTSSVDFDAKTIDSGYLGANGAPIDVTDEARFRCYDASVVASDAVARAMGIDPDDPQAMMNSSIYDSADYRNAGNRALADCLARTGISAQYTDLLPGSMLWPMRGVVTGIYLLLTAAFLGIGAIRLRRAVATR